MALGHACYFFIDYRFYSVSVSVQQNEEVGSNTKPHVGLVDLNGEIFDSKAANADDFAQGHGELLIKIQD